MRAATHTVVKSLAQIAGAVALVLFAIWIAIAQPTFRGNRPSPVTADPVRLRSHVEALSQRFHPRDWAHTANLAACADYVEAGLREAGAAVASQEFSAAHRPYCNVIGRFAAGRGRKIVVGAHYDACGDTPGADDNASGVAALLELARLLGAHPPDREVELVAYCLEEPPFFRSAFMGSAIHAKNLARDKAGVRGVIVLEMVGFFSDEPGSQSYPSFLFRLLYPGRANFIGVVSRWDQGDWVKTVKTGMKGTTALPVCSIRAPAVVPGIDFSDHLNYWPHGIPAVMVTDTSFYRNPAYHESGDTAERLDYRRMAQVVVAVFEAIRSI